jgi:hypothetical protein
MPKLKAVASIALETAVGLSVQASAAFPMAFPAVTELPVSWPADLGSPAATRCPEELIAESRRLAVQFGITKLSHTRQRPLTRADRYSSPSGSMTTIRHD